MVKVDYITLGTRLYEIVEKIQNRTNFIVLDKNGDYYGVLPYDVLLRASLDLNTKIDKFVVKINPLPKDYDIKIAMKKILTVGIRILPVLENGEIKVISVYDILKEIRSLLTDYVVGDIRYSPAYTINEKDSIKKAIQLMKRYRTNRLIVVNNKEIPTGIITVGDIIRALFIEKKKAKLGEVSEKELKIEVRSLMSHELISVDTSTKLVEVANIMLNNNIYAVPVIENERIFGMITAKDLIKFVDSLMPEEKLYQLLISGIELSEITLRNLQKKIDKLVRMFQDILGSDIIVNVNIKEIKGKPRRFLIKLRVSGSRAKAIAEEINTSIVKALNDAINDITKELSRRKPKSWRKDILRRIFRFL